MLLHSNTTCIIAHVQLHHYNLLTCGVVQNNIIKTCAVQYCAMQELSKHYNEYTHTALYATVLGGERRVVGLYDPKFPQGLRIEWTKNSSTTSSLVWKTKDGLPPKDSSDRVVSVIFVSRPVYIAMSTVSFLGMLVAVGFLVFNIKLRKIRWVSP